LKFQDPNSFEFAVLSMIQVQILVDVYYS
jgi:hypothetical protein